MKRIVLSLVLLSLFASYGYSQVPSITSFSPTSGSVGSTVSINGANFDPTPANDVVYFGAVKAHIVSASAAQLIVTVPAGASFTPVSITVNGLTGYSSAPFIVTFGGAALSSHSFFPKLDFATGNLPYGVACGDLDGDGKPDFVVTNNTANSISVFRNTGSGDSISSNSFAAGVDFATGSGPWGVALADLDGDGKLDIVVSNGNSGTISVFRNTSTVGSITSGSFAAKADFATGSGGGGGYGIAVADLDGDGKPDIVVTNRNSNSISVFQNTSGIGTINFSASVGFSAGRLPYGVAVGDLDGDGKIDIVVANSGDDSISIFPNVSTSGSITSASFSPKIDLALSGTPIAVAVADVNGDGKPEIISAKTSDSTLSVLQNESSGGSITSGSFAAEVNFKLNSAPNSVALGDFSGDGKPDIAVANSNSNTISVFQNANGTGQAVSTNSFESEVDFMTASLPFGLAIVDFNGDGRPDLVATSSGTNAASVFLSDVGVPLIAVSKTFINFGYIALGDSSVQDVVLNDLSADTLVVDTVYADRKELALSTSHGKSIDSLGVQLVFRADSVGQFNDTIFIKSNAVTPLVKIPVSSNVYTHPGRPASCAVTPSGWSNGASFTLTWINQPGMLPIDKIWYAVDTLPHNATVVNSQFAADTTASVSMTQVGTHTLYFYLEDSLGNKNSDSVGSVVMMFDNNGPTIVQNNSSLDTIFVQADGSLTAIPPIVASASEPSNESGVMALTLLYRRLDEEAWTSVNFSGVANSSLTIPTASFVKNNTVVGAEYRVQAIDSAGNTTLSNLLSFEIRYASDLPVNNFSDIPSVHSLSLPSGQEIKAYRIFSVPYEPEDERPASFIDPSFGPHAKQGVPYVNWRLTRWFNGAWDDYDSFKDSSVVVPGAGFFLVTENQGRASTLAKPELIRPDKMLYVGIQLNQGWNIIGDPFPVDVPFDHLIFQGGTCLAHYYFSGTGPQGGWEGSGPDFDTLRSWQGLAVDVDSAALLKFDLTGVLLPPSAGRSKGESSGTSKGAVPQQSKEWTLDFDAVRDDIAMSCIGNEIGMRPGATKGFDPSDRLQAPFVGGHNILVSMQNEKGPLMKDIRPFNAEGDVWEITVTTGDAYAKTKLIFGSLDGASRQGFEATLVDSAKGLAYDLKEKKEIDGTTGSDGVAKFRLIVGTASFVAKNLGDIALIPQQPNLYNNYPNPFNPETIIRYAVPATMPTARVVLKVYNILGQEVRTLVNGTNAPGFYEVSFDGTTLSSGVYFYDISITGGAASYRAAKKMLLVR
ncbi:MAG TPA: FG-GAP-like repeat-containing protein [Bacteroidota bacterium]|nr:FG-GAP-like repeat-containing protein [Bacteroidota bacterium]